MKIIYYCQHVLGMGHYFRSLEICKALVGHDVILVSGGMPMAAPTPAHVRVVALPDLHMDPDFSRFETADGALGNIDDIRRVRRRMLLDLVMSERPDVFMVELFPFGRKAFGFELKPVLAAVHDVKPRVTRVVCSLRDILVEKPDVQAYEERVVTLLNRWFDALLVHSDPGLVRLDETFSRLADIRIPVVYTGFVTPRPPPEDRIAIRRRLGVQDADMLIVASAGGGRVGFMLLDAAVCAVPMMTDAAVRLQVFTGPFMEDAEVRKLEAMASGRVRISRFTPDFTAWLSAADLSISMAGYNTCMNIAAAGVRSLVWPFSQNREQRLRAEKIAAGGGMRILEDAELEPERLALLMTELLSDKTRPEYRVNLDGAAYTTGWIGGWTGIGGCDRVS